MQQRVLRFRVWDGRKMYYNDNVVGTWGKENDRFMVADVADRECVNPWHEPPLDVMQLVGAKDLEGCNIWEKDIVYTESRSQLGVLIYQPDMMRFGLQLIGSKEVTRITSRVTVLGNIYQPLNNFGPNDLKWLEELKTNGCQQGFKEYGFDDDE